MTDELFQSIRSAASSHSWSRAVELVRADAVAGERQEENEIVVRVATRGGLISPTVTLFLDDEDWDCDCGTSEDVCEHVAAAAIALRRASSQRQDLFSRGTSHGRIGYRFSREAGGLALERVVVTGDEETLLTTTLVAVASGRVEGPRFLATRADLSIEQTLGSKRRGRVPRGILPTLLGQLAECPDVKLDAEPVVTSAAEVGFVALVEDDDGGFRVRVARDDSAAESFDNVAALCGKTLRPLQTTRLTGREIEDFTRNGKHFAADEAVRLVTDILPALAERIPIEVRTKRLPTTVREQPRLEIEVSRNGEALSVLPILVYGDPPIARIDAGRLTPLGDGPLPRRDEAAEEILIRRLQHELALLPGRLLPGRRFEVSGEAAITVAEQLERFSGKLRGSVHKQFFRAPQLEARLRGGDGRFDVVFSSDVDGTPHHASSRRVLAAWRAGESLVPLEGGGFATLPTDWLTRFGDRIADLLAAKQATGDLPRAILPELARLYQDLDQPLPPSLKGLGSLLDADGEIPQASLPEDLSASLRGYQRRGVDWLCALRDAGFGALLADDMGLGKTIQALCALRGRTLVVAPTSVLFNWRNEIERFRPGLTTSTYHGASRRLDPDADVTLTTYALLRIDAEILCAEHWDTVILDEAQKIKNPDSQVARAAYRLQADFPMALTGTPVENRLEELWSQIHFTQRGLLGGRRDFNERYERPIGEGDAQVTARLRARIAPFVLRRLKQDVASELPPRTDIVIHVELDPEEQRIYDAIRAATRDDVVRQLESGGSVLGALEALLRLRQASCHPALVPGQTARTSSKLTVLREMLDEVVAEDHKALVFSQWTSLLDLVEPELREAGLAFGRLDGRTRDRAGVIGSFQDENGPPVLLVSLTAGGVGINLTAADHVFILDPWWNPAVEDQAADRAHRIGQDRPVMVYRLVAQGSVEEKILALQEKKRELAEAALGGRERAAGVTRQDLLALLE